MILPMFNALKLEFRVSVLLLGASITVYMLPYSIVQFFSGVLSDVLFGRRLLVVSDFLIYALGGFIASFSPTIWFFLAGRAVQGIGNAMVMSILLALVGDIFEVGIRGRIMGLAAVATTLGTTFGPIFGGLVAEYNWRFSFLIVALTSLFLVLAFSRVLSERYVKRGSRLIGLHRG